MSNTIVIDDRDPRIRWSTGWEDHGSSAEFNSTTRFSMTAGSFWSFTFNGTSISVFGTIDSLGVGRPNSTYVLDGTNPVRYSASPNGGVQYQQLFYQSPTLPNVEHTLLVTVIDEGSRYFLDFLTVNTAPASSASLTQSASVSPTQSGAQTGTGASGSGSGTNVGAIVGGVVGGVAFILLLLGFLWWNRRRKRASVEDMQYNGVSTAPVSHLDTSFFPSDAESNFIHTPLTSEELQDARPRPFPTPRSDAGTLSLSSPGFGAASSTYASTIVTQSRFESGLATDQKSGVHLSHRPDQSLDDGGDQPPPAYGG